MVNFTKNDIKNTIKDQITSCVSQNGWIDDISEISFLAAGEYNENYLIQEASGRKYVFRINRGSQLGIENQIGYEYNILQALKESGVTPVPLGYDNNTPIFDRGVLLMEYIPGRKFNYNRDLSSAAKIFAKIHSMSFKRGDNYPFIIRQPIPLLSIAAESRGLIDRFDGHPLVKEKKLLTEYCAKIEKKGDSLISFFTGEHHCIVNTEVNSGNFIINNKSGKEHLVDWEKAVYSSRYQDLAHFLVTTTTNWKTNFTFSCNKKRNFLALYRVYLLEQLDKNEVPTIEEIETMTEIMEKTILLRALSWCFMAYYEYTEADRVLKNEDTFKKIREYMGEIECLLPSRV
jgi:thiamine kinase-like enzyme